MAAKPKMTPAQWDSTRAAWEADPRDGYAWLVEELALPVSIQGVRQTAVKGLWVKGGKEKVESTKVVKVVKVVANNHAKAPATIKTTMTTTLPATMPEAPKDTAQEVAELDGSNLTLSKIERQDGAQLTPNEERFVAEFLIDLNGTAAYKRVFPDVTDGSARTLGARLLAKVHISAAVEKAKAERAARTGISADRALAEVWSVATADPRELVQVKVGCCRHCYGEGSQRQRTVGEMNRAREKHATKGKDMADFDEEGGIGFNPHRPPNPQCPECCGDGHARVVLADTRNLSPQAAALYAGAKQGKHGIELQLQGKAEAQRKVFEHLGLNKQVVEVNLSVFPPREVLDAIYDKALGEAAKRDAMLAGRRERLGIVIENGESHD